MATNQPTYSNHQTSKTNFFGVFVQKIMEPVSAAPLAVFRVLFGMVMLASIIRFAAKGWICELYIAPQFHFTYYGFEWVKPLGEYGMYTIFLLMGLSALFVALGCFYRVAATVFFITFTYVELIDKTNYLNHYYFISVVSFLLILLPANRYFSIDALRNPSKFSKLVPAWTIGVVRLQLGVVYFFAGLAKLNSDWLLEALPLKIWLPAHAHLPVIGELFTYTETAYFFSWTGALYDLSIPFLLLFSRTRWLAYVAVIAFHGLTALLFPIGMFPYIMILCTLVFFPASFHQKLISFLPKFGSINYKSAPIRTPKLLIPVLAIFFVIQLAIPFRYLLYPGNLFWTEQGYRFSWRVMLMEKAGYTIFHVKDPKTGRKGEAMAADFLTPNQEKMMATQPDMILQFAHYLEEHYKQKGIENPEIRAESYVTLNGRGSRPFINPETNLAMVSDGFKHKEWILPYAK